MKQLFDREEELDRLRHETARQQAEITRLARQITLLVAELRRSEADRVSLKNLMDELRQQVISAPAKPSCAFCHRVFEQPETGRRARFCSPLCRLHYHRETKRNNNVSTQEGKQ